MPSFDASTKVGFASAASPVAWAGGGGARSVVDWLPRFDEPVVEVRDNRGNVIGKGYLTKRAWNYWREIGDRLGGVQGPSVTQIQSSVVATQAQVAETTNYAVQVSDYATQVAATASATKEVATNNSLSGSGSIPDTGDPPPRPGTQPL